jgi:hypothetical protein
MNKIKRVSRRFRILFQILFYFTPVAVLWFWLSLHGPIDLFSKLGIGAALFMHPVTINGITRILGIIVTMLPAGILMYALAQLIKLFKHYEHGEIFTIDNANRYRKLGYTLFAWVIGGLIYDALISLVMTFQNSGAGQKVVAIGVNGIDIVVIITGGLILLIAWVMKEAQKISEEQSLTI